MGTYFIFIAILIFGTIISFILSDIKIELKYRNTLLDKQNDILKNNN